MPGLEQFSDTPPDPTAPRTLATLELTYNLGPATIDAMSEEERAKYKEDIEKRTKMVELTARLNEIAKKVGGEKAYKVLEDVRRQFVLTENRINFYSKELESIDNQTHPILREISEEEDSKIKERLEVDLENRKAFLREQIPGLKKSLETVTDEDAWDRAEHLMLEVAYEYLAAKAACDEFEPGVGRESWLDAVHKRLDSASKHIQKTPLAKLVYRAKFSPEELEKFPFTAQ